MGSEPVVGTEERWRHLVSAAFHLDEVSAQQDKAMEAAVTTVDSALEVFTSSIDPVDDFEGYAVRRLLLALRRALSTRAGAGAE